MYIYIYICIYMCINIYIYIYMCIYIYIIHNNNDHINNNSMPIRELREASGGLRRLPETSVRTSIYR